MLREEILEKKSSLDKDETMEKEIKERDEIYIG